MFLLGDYQKMYNVPPRWWTRRRLSERSSSVINRKLCKCSSSNEPKAEWMILLGGEQKTEWMFLLGDEQKASEFSSLVMNRRLGEFSSSVMKRRLCEFSS
jgi:hypothetical protein